MQKTKSKVSRVLNQARESLKVLETLEKETFARAKTFVKNPLPRGRKSLTNDKILASLKSMGVATRAELVILDEKMERMEAEIATLNTLLTQAGVKRPKLPPKSQPSGEAFPNT